jgi:putative transposase
VSENPDGKWVTQITRNVTGCGEPMSEASYLIHDRDSKYTRDFRNLLKSSGIEPIRLPPKSPNLNAYAERFVRSVKEECLNWFILFGEKSLRHILKEYMAHCHTERNHQGMENVIPFPDERLVNAGKSVQKSERLGGLLNFYHRDAA